MTGRLGDLGIGCAIALLSVGCGHARVLAPRFVSVAGYDEAAAAYRCEDEYEVVEVEGRGLGAAPSCRSRAGSLAARSRRSGIGSPGR